MRQADQPLPRTAFSRRKIQKYREVNLKESLACAKQRSLIPSCPCFAAEKIFFRTPTLHVVQKVSHRISYDKKATESRRGVSLVADVPDLSDNHEISGKKNLHECVQTHQSPKILATCST